MSEPQTETVAPAKVDFIAYHRPALLPGTYTITVQQTVAGRSLSEQPFVITRHFTVAGERFGLTPADVAAVFPPEGSLGDHAQVLPHIQLARSTLPWEQVADDEQKKTPWLALLLLYEDEGLGGVVARQAFSDALGTVGAAAWKALLSSEVGWLRPLPDDPTRALVVAKNLRAARTLPTDLVDKTGAIEVALDGWRSPQLLTLDELKAQSDKGLHWPGLGYDPNVHTGADKATVIDVEHDLLKALLPGAAGLSLLAHVRRGADGAEQAVVVGSRLPQRNGVSIAHLVSIEGRYESDGNFNFDGAQSGDYVRLVSLHSWRFACLDPAGDFTGLVRRLDRKPSTLRLPHSPDPALDRLLASGRVPATHRTRAGAAGTCWYSSPLRPQATSVQVTLPAESSAELARDDPTLGLRDVSYAAAWELGRLLMLQSKPISLQLYQWKRTHAQSLRQTETRLLDPTWTGRGTPEGLPLEVAAWFADLRLLKGIPLPYLVPDERMLPPESLRLFRLDWAWVDALVDGAFSIGRVASQLASLDNDQHQAFAGALPPTKQISGFLLRSTVVPGWPGLLADALGPDGQPLEQRRLERLGPNVLLGLFAGELRTLALHLQPEALHFGFDSHKLPDHENGVIDIVALAGAEATAATFAVARVAGVPKIIFT